MRTRDGRGRPKRKAPGVEAGGGAKTLGGLSDSERSTRRGGWVPLRARLAPAYLAPWDPRRHIDETDKSPYTRTALSPRDVEALRARARRLLSGCLEDIGPQHPDYAAVSALAARLSC